jgi:hypothetical protein
MKSFIYLGVTVPLRNNCKNNCVMAKIQAMSGETSHTAPRNRDFPQNFRKTARLMFSNKNTHVTPEKERNIHELKGKSYKFRLETCSLERLNGCLLFRSGTKALCSL